MEHQTNRVMSTFPSVRDTVSTGLEQIRALQKENDALKERVVRLQESRIQLQKKLKRSVKRQLHAKSCVGKVTEESLQLKEVERERQADAERWRKREEEWRVTENRANGVICILRDELQALKRDKEKVSNSGRFRTIVAQKNCELKSAEAKWRHKLRNLYGIYERELALRGDMWGRKVTELEREKQEEAERWKRREELWKTAAGRKDKEPFSELAQLRQTPKEEDEEREHPRKRSKKGGGEKTPVARDLRPFTNSLPYPPTYTSAFVYMYIFTIFYYIYHMLQ